MVKMSTQTQKHLNSGQLTLTQAALKAGVQLPSIYTYWKKNKLWMAKMGRHTLVKDVDVDAYIERRASGLNRRGRPSKIEQAEKAALQNGHVEEPVAHKPIIRVVSTRPTPEVANPVVDVTQEQIVAADAVVTTPRETTWSDNPVTRLRAELSVRRTEAQARMVDVAEAYTKAKEQYDLLQLELDEIERQDQTLTGLETFLSGGSVV